MHFTDEFCERVFQQAETFCEVITYSSQYHCHRCKIREETGSSSNLVILELQSYFFSI